MARSAAFCSLGNIQNTSSPSAVAGVLHAGGKRQVVTTLRVAALRQPSTPPLAER